MKQTLIIMIITLSYLVGHNYSRPNKYLYFLNDTTRIEKIGSDAEIVKKELRKIINNIKEDVTISYSTIEIQGAVYKTVIEPKPYDFEAHMQDKISHKLIYGVAVDPITDQLLKEKHSTRQVRKLITPRKEIQKNKSIDMAQDGDYSIVGFMAAKWSDVIDYYGGYAEATEAGISKNDLNRFRIKAKLKNIELISPTECYANITLEGDKNYAFKYHNISKADYKYRGTYQIDEIDAIDIYNMTMPNIVFSFDEKEYLNNTQFKIPLEKALDKPVGLKEKYKNYRTTIIQLLDDFADEEWEEYKKYRDDLLKKVDELLHIQYTNSHHHHWLFEDSRWTDPGYFDNLSSKSIEAEIVAINKHVEDNRFFDDKMVSCLFVCCVLPLLLLFI